MGSIISDIGKTLNPVNTIAQQLGIKSADSGGFLGEFLDPLGVHNYLDPLHLFGTPKQEQSYQDTYKNFTNQMMDEAAPFLKAAESGMLTPGQQAAVKAFTQQQTTQGEMASAKAGLGRSTTEVELKNQAIQSGQEYANQFITQDFQEGLSLLGAASGNVSQLAQLTLAQNEMMGQALGNAGSAIGNIVGSGGSGLTPTNISSPSPDVIPLQPITIPDFQPIPQAPVFPGG